MNNNHLTRKAAVCVHCAEISIILYRFSNDPSMANTATTHINDMIDHHAHLHLHAAKPSKQFSMVFLMHRHFCVVHFLVSFYISRKE